jgi:hypothetical protein
MMVWPVIAFDPRHGIANLFVLKGRPFTLSCVGKALFALSWEPIASGRDDGLFLVRNPS